jgi:predicted short-subunit dehydrogenase-like oxidoreductase (DUF2520 family)
MSNIAIVGGGTVGSVLGKVLAANGERVVIVVSRALHSARKAARFIGCKSASDSVADIPRRTSVVLIATPHATIKDVALQLSVHRELNFRRLAVCHTSGMLTAAALQSVNDRGADVFSFHPLQTFPREFKPGDIVPLARGISYGVDGSPRALRKAASLAQKLDGRILKVPPELRAFYHAACVVASNHLTTILSILESMFGRLGTKERRFLRVFTPIILATIENARKTSPADALSGPVARGGVETVAGHLSAIREVDPGLISYFGTLTLETVKLARAKGSITDEQAKAITNLVESGVFPSYRSLE